MRFSHCDLIMGVCMIVRIETRRDLAGTGQAAGQFNYCCSILRVEDRCGALALATQNDEYGNTLYSFAQALVENADISCVLR